MAEETPPQAPFAHNRIPTNIADEMRQSYMDYAMSVIIGRALPDIRDGLEAGEPARALRHAADGPAAGPALPGSAPRSSAR